jgi:hypothetical protein
MGVNLVLKFNPRFKLSRRCLDNFPRRKKGAHLGDIRSRKTPPQFCREIKGQPLEEFLPVVGFRFPPLLEVDDPPPDFPIRGREKIVDRVNRGRPSVLQKSMNA